MKPLMCDMSGLSSLPRRRQFQKSPEPATVMKPLMCDMSALSSLPRRRQFQKSPEPATVMKPLMCDMSAPVFSPQTASVPEVSGACHRDEAADV